MPPLTTILHPVAPSHTAQAALSAHWSFKGTTYYFGHKIAEVEAVFGHHGTQDLGDWFGRFGFQPHRAVNGYQVQSKSKEHKRMSARI